MISQTGEYALRAVVALAGAKSENLTAQEIAGIGRVPPGYMAKVLQVLHRAGLVRSRRGLNGGFSLSRPPARMSALEVLAAVEPAARILACPLELSEHQNGLCPLHRRLDEIAVEFHAALGATRIVDLLQGPGSESRPCLGGLRAVEATPHGVVDEGRMS